MGWIFGNTSLDTLPVGVGRANTVWVLYRILVSDWHNVLYPEGVKSVAWGSAPYALTYGVFSTVSEIFSALKGHPALARGEAPR